MVDESEETSPSSSDGLSLDADLFSDSDSAPDEPVDSRESNFDNVLSEPIAESVSPLFEIPLPEESLPTKSDQLNDFGPEDLLGENAFEASLLETDALFKKNQRAFCPTSFLKICPTNHL